MLEFIKKKDEDIVEYMIRLYSNKTNYGLNNKEIAELLNKEDGSDFDESRWRKLYQGYKNFFEPYIIKQSSKGVNKHIIETYQKAQIEAQKEKYRMQDYRTAYNRIIREEARRETIRDIIKDTLVALPATYDPIDVPEDCENEIVLNITDWHVGAEFYGRLNSYNVDIFHERLDTLIAKAKQYILKNPTKKLHIASLGDMVSGELRVSNRVENQEHIVNQIKIAAEGISKLVSELAPMVEQVEFYYTMGNHGRTTGNKEIATGVTEENYERIIVWFLQERLRDFKNVNIIEDFDGIIEAEVNGYNFVFQHGDMGTKANISKLGNLLSSQVDYVCMGHTHNFHSEQMLNTRMLVTSSMMGADAYATRGRFGNQVAQTIINVVRTPQGMDDEIKLLTL